MERKKKLPFYEYERFSWLNQLQCVFQSQGKNFHSVPRKGNGESKKKKDNLTINRIKKRERGRKGKKTEVKGKLPYTEQRQEMRSRQERR